MPLESCRLYLLSLAVCLRSSGEAARRKSRRASRFVNVPATADDEERQRIDDDETERLMHCLTCPVMRFHYTALNAVMEAW